MAIGAKDPVLGPPVMNELRKIIRNCPEPYVHAEGGHFLQEWGEDVAREALEAMEVDPEVTFDDVAARARAHQARTSTRTPVLTSATVDALTGAQVFFKRENLQRMGAFKFRGAYNALSQLSPDEKKRGRRRLLVGQSRAGGGARRASCSASRASSSCRRTRRKVKLEATRGYGAKSCSTSKNEDREKLARKARRRARPDAHPALRPPAHRRRPGHRGEGADRGRRAARPAAGALRRRRPALGLRRSRPST